MKLQSIKKRADFLCVRGGNRWSNPAFLVEAKARPTHQAGLTGVQQPEEARFGFTITKKIGNAVVRNRIRRRLKEAVRKVAAPLANPTFDYVVVARKAIREAVFATLCADLAKGIARTSKTITKSKARSPSGKSSPKTSNKSADRDEVPLSLGPKTRQTSGRKPS